MKNAVNSILLGTPIYGVVEGLLNEADDKERGILRDIAVDPTPFNRGRLFRHRVRTRKWRNYPMVLAHATEGPWRDRWVVIVHDMFGRYNSGLEPAMMDEFNDEHGYPDDNWEDPWVVAIGDGYWTVRYLVYARNASDALTACEEQWPSAFLPTYDDNGEVDTEPEIRVVSRCDEWQVGRKMDYSEHRARADALKEIDVPEGRDAWSLDTELLDGRLVERV